MVRTYKEDDFSLLSPWEKAMRIADNGTDSRLTTGIRTYNKMSPSPITTAYNEYKVLKLPPISEDPQQTIEFLGEEVGKLLLRSKRKLKTIKRELALYDPLETGRILKTAGYEILKRYKLPPNDNYQRKIIAIFATSDEPGKIDRVKLMDFLENSSLQYQKIAEMKKQEESRKPTAQKFIDSTHGRYDSESSSQFQNTEPRKTEMVHQAFADRRDAGLSIEIERAFKASGQDPHEAIDLLETSITNSTTMNPRQYDLKLVNNKHLKGLVAKHQFPLNDALTLKCIERLDAYGNGEIHWPKFIDFLRKSVSGIQPSRNEYYNSQISLETSNSSTTLSSGIAPWELKKPLQNIKTINSDSDGFSMSADSAGVDTSETSSHNNYLEVDSHHNPSYPNVSDDLLNNTSDANSFHSNKWDDSFDHINKMDRSHEERDEPDLPAITVDTYDEKLQKLSGKGEVYKRVADALYDRALLNDGLISTNDVRKTVNYYNLLFDADINLEKMNASLDKNSKNDYVKIDVIIDSLGIM